MPFDPTSTYIGAVASGDTGTANLLNSFYAQKAATSSDLPDPGNAGVVGMTTEGELGGGGPVGVFRDNGTSFEYMGSLKGLVGVELTNATQVLSTGSWNTLDFPTSTSEIFDSDAFHSTVSNTSRITIPSGMGGVYSIMANAKVSQTGGVTETVSIRMALNGATSVFMAEQMVQIGTASLGNLIALSIATRHDFTSGDYIEAAIYKDGGDAETIRYPTFSAWKEE